MSLPPAWIAVAAVLALLLGLWLMLAGRAMRQRRGLGEGQTVALDSGFFCISPRKGIASKKPVAPEWSGLSHNLGVLQRQPA
jgi:hypothetical protein